MRCQAKIVGEHKSRKADCCWPEYRPHLDIIQNEWATGLERCGGEIEISVKAVDTPDYHSDHYAELEIDVTCSRCKNPYIKGLSLLYSEEKIKLLATALAWYLEHQQGKESDAAQPDTTLSNPRCRA